MVIDKTKLVFQKGYYEGTLDAVDEKTALETSHYKKNVCRNFISINPEQIESRIGGQEFYITRKFDGEMNVIFFNGTDTFTINTGGKIRLGIPCIEEAGRLLKEAGVKSAIIPSELYMCEKEGRTRVFDVLSALSRENSIGDLCLAPFDIIELDGAPQRAKNYEDTHNILKGLFKGSESVKPVLFMKVPSKAGIMDTYKKLVDEEGSEGIIVRSELPLVYKVKPKHNIDVVVVGYTEGTGDCKGQIRTLLLALMTDENSYQIVGKTGNGLTDEKKKELFNVLSGKCIDSEYIETDSNHVAFHMVRPETVIEISFNDILFENSTSFINNPLLDIRDDRYRMQSVVRGISFIYPIFVRVRDDKKADEVGTRFSQVTDLYYIPDLKEGSRPQELPKSEVILREVYKKISGTKLMVQKFLVWKTNKETVDKSYPAYVMHYTNFSSDRKEPLQRDIRVSGDRDQILAITNTFIEENIKKGWSRVE